MQAASNETSHTNPKRKRGNGLTASLTLRVGIISGRAGFRIQGSGGSGLEPELEHHRYQQDEVRGEAAISERGAAVNWKHDGTRNSLIRPPHPCPAKIGHPPTQWSSDSCADL